jgi:hypothetical protein
MCKRKAAQPTFESVNSIIPLLAVHCSFSLCSNASSSTIWVIASSRSSIIVMRCSYSTAWGLAARGNSEIAAQNT